MKSGNKNEKLGNYDIKNYIKQGAPILVQVKRDCTNKKGARVSTHISIPGRFAVLMQTLNLLLFQRKLKRNKKEKDLLI